VLKPLGIESHDLQMEARVYPTTAEKDITGGSKLPFTGGF
jgi:hypothetical protein